MGLRGWRYGLIGALLSAGAPLGWLAIRLILAPSILDDLRAEVQGHAAWYAYLLAGTATAFATFGAVLGALADRLVRANQELGDMVVTDSLTGLKNRRYFQARLEEECGRSKRGGRPVALLMADLDHFKRVNDSHGHPVGDEVLAHVGRALQEAARAGDSACRIGGEEFAVVCPGSALEDALVLAERLRATLERTPARTSVGSLPITASFGVAVVPPGGQADALLRAADAALYAAKSAGRNRVHPMPSLVASPSAEQRAGE